MSPLTPHSYAAHQVLKQAYASGKVVFFTDPRILARPGSPLYSPLEVFLPPLVLMAGSLVLLFTVGLIEWIVVLILILIYQMYGAPRVLNWRVHQRAVEAVLKNPHNLQILWTVGGLAIALKDWPERACVSPRDDWATFCDEFLRQPEEPEQYQEQYQEPEPEQEPEQEP
jgi:hypothetical protein